MATSEITFRQHKNTLAVYLLVDLLILSWLFGLGLVLALYHYLRYQNTGITLGSKSVTLIRGGLGSKVTQVPYAKINSVTISQGILGKTWNSGDVIISTGNDVTGITFRGIENPHLLKETIEKRTK
jgi:membrane protein YdbS with pleckstrin-like domain